MKKTAQYSILFLFICLILTSCVSISLTFGKNTATPEPTINYPTQTPTIATGSIQGRLGYPSDSIPALHIVAFLYGTDTYFSVDTEQNQTSYKLSGLIEGNYHIVAYTMGSEGIPEGLTGGFTKAAACGMQPECSDHTLVDVSVAAGEAVVNVDILDWLVAAPPKPQPGEPVFGAITGRLSYPSEFIPPMKVVAFSLIDGRTFSVDTENNIGTYVLPVPKGKYHVVAYVGGKESTPTSLAGGYSQAVPCGLSVNCLDHSLIDVEVEQGSVTSGVDPGDFYAPEGTFPPAP